jgi:hypothetical protein
LQMSILLSLLEKLACARPFDIRYMTHEVVPPYYIKVAPGAKEEGKMVFTARFVVLSGDKKDPPEASWREGPATRKMGKGQVKVNITPYAKGGWLPDAFPTRRVKEDVLDYIEKLYYSPEALADSETPVAPRQSNHLPYNPLDLLVDASLKVDASSSRFPGGIPVLDRARLRTRDIDRVFPVVVSL